MNNSVTYVLSAGEADILIILFVPWLLGKLLIHNNDIISYLLAPCALFGVITCTGTRGTQPIIHYENKLKTHDKRHTNEHRME